MNLIQFISYLKKDEKAHNYLTVNYPDIDYFNAEIYLKDLICVESELFFFDDTKIEGTIEMIVNKQKFLNLFSLDHLVELIEDYSDSITSDQLTAERIIDFRLNDA
jgi:hypothetical protein